MNILAKFNCTQVVKEPGIEKVTLSPVTGDSEENKTFSKYTPSGRLEMSITNPSAFGAFEPGKSYRLTFEPAE